MSGNAKGLAGLQALRFVAALLTLVFVSAAGAQGDADNAAAPGGEGDPNDALAEDAAPVDSNPQEPLEVYPYIGIAIDNFAASDVASYLNFSESGDVKTRETFGIAFQYPLFNGHLGTGESGKTTSKFSKSSLWIFGQTMHGVRSADVDCGAYPTNPLCTPFEDVINNPADPTQRALYILRNASSLEALLGIRYEFATLPNNNARLYVSAQSGLVAVEDDDDDVADVNHLGVGLRVANGRYRNSYIEVGRGQTDLFEDNPKDRYKINARIVTRPTAFKNRSILFAHIVADVDRGDGADSIQTYVGFAFCFGKRDDIPSGPTNRACMNQ